MPYNTVLSHTFVSHINVDNFNSVKFIKYICKYVNEGSDQASFTVEDFDEVTKYQKRRFISSSEAVWRIFRFFIHNRFSSLMHLTVHHENGERIYFTEKDVVDNVVHPPKTTLLTFKSFAELMTAKI